jgi:diguanylate cyclase (GGDEF)-like protein
MLDDLIRRPPQRAPVSAVHRRFERVLRAMFVIGLAAYGTFLGLFLYLDVPGMPLVNAGVLVVTLLCLWLLARGAVRLALGAGSLMVIVHVSCATLLLGWAGEFHLYAFLVLCLLMLSPTLGARTKFGVFSALTAGYVVAWWHLSGVAAGTPLAPVFGALNVVVFAALLGLLAAIYSSATTQTADEYEARNAELARQAITDPLTGLFNRRHLREILQQEHARFQRTARPFAVIVGDIDHFKIINDRHGHQCGDAVIVAVSAVIRDAVRASDFVARWGGEEFLIFLPETSLQEALATAERIQQQLAQSPVSYRNVVLEARMTLGVATAESSQSIDELLRRADEALYRGKRAGRNRIEVYLAAVAA